jgi:4-hydroxybenzoyl-CoA thioesterase
VIEWGDCDPAEIVFNPNFFAFFDHGTALLYGAAGWTKKEMLRIFGGAGCPLISTSAEFRAPCSYGDAVAITSTIVKVGRTSFEIGHELRKGETLCVVGTEVRVWTVRDPESGVLKSAPLPEELRLRFVESPSR